MKKWLQMAVLAVACEQLSGTFISPGSGAFKRFVISNLLLRDYEI